MLKTVEVLNVLVETMIYFFSGLYDEQHLFAFKLLEPYKCLPLKILLLLINLMHPR